MISRRFFVILALMIITFYILVVLQIALGLYSLWDGFRVASHGPAPAGLARGLLRAGGGA